MVKVDIAKAIRFLEASKIDEKVGRLMVGSLRGVLRDVSVDKVCVD